MAICIWWGGLNPLWVKLLFNSFHNSNNFLSRPFLNWLVLGCKIRSLHFIHYADEVQLIQKGFRSYFRDGLGFHQVQFGGWAVPLKLLFTLQIIWFWNWNCWWISLAGSDGAKFETRCKLETQVDLFLHQNKTSFARETTKQIQIGINNPIRKKVILFVSCYIKYIIHIT